MIRAPRDEKGKSKYQLELPARDLLISDEKSNSQKVIILKLVMESIIKLLS